MAVDLVNGGDDATGTFISGGTESILLSLKATRNYSRAVKPEITDPEILMPKTAQPAFHKACTYFDRPSMWMTISVPSRRRWRRP